MDTEVLDRPKVPVTARPKTTADILEAAALYIEEFGWAQNFNRDNGLCAYAAILRTNSRSSEDHAAMLALAPVIGVEDGTTGALAGSVGRWNDQPGRQQYEVTAALREAAKRARAVTTRSAQDGS